ncbi:MAG: ATP synthase subunit I [Gallionella sp.]
MNELSGLAFACAAGILLGDFFFGGLWWTVRKGVTAKHPALWFLGSMLLRTSIVVLGFYFVMGGDWMKLLAGLFGFIVARVIVMRLTRAANPSGPLAQEAGHAP